MCVAHLYRVNAPESLQMMFNDLQYLLVSIERTLHSIWENFFGSKSWWLIDSLIETLFVLICHTIPFCIFNFRFARKKTTPIFKCWKIGQFEMKRKHKNYFIDIFDAMLIDRSIDCKCNGPNEQENNYCNASKYRPNSYSMCNPLQ